jgi:CheY-like chemotaxis protein
MMTAVLIVDDEPDIAELFESEFQDFGFTTFSAGNINSAKTILSSNSIDIVLSDVRMPGGNGIELLKWVRANCPPSLIFLIMTGYSDVSLAEALSLGAHGLFAKPVDLEKIIGCARACMELRHDSGPANRRSTRKPVNLRATITQVGDLSPFPATVLDLSRGGFFFSTPNQNVAPGAELDFRIDCQIKNRLEISGKAIVRWTKYLAGDSTQSSRSAPAKFGAGAEFLQLNKNSSEDLLGILTILEIYPIGDVLALEEDEIQQVSK